MTSTREALRAGLGPVTGRGFVDVVALAGVLALVVLAHLAGRALEASGAILLLPFPPIFATWAPHLSLWTLAALALVFAASRLQRASDHLAWPVLVTAGWGIGLAWIFSLASVDGDWATKLLSPHEYLHDLAWIGDPGQFLREFTSRIVGVPDAWTTHVSVHPPLATLFFWGLRQAGLGGPAWAALACMVVGSLALPAWATTLRVLGAETAARRLVPFAALFPGAVWIGVSGDAVFLGVAALGVMAAVVGAVRRSWPASVGGGVLLGAMLYLSYGHVVYAPVVAAAVWHSARRMGWARVRRGWLLTLAGLAAVAAAFTAAGFNWLTALAQVRLRYDEGIASVRPYSYFVWANLAAVAVCASPVVALVVTEAVRSVARRPREPASAPAWFALAGLVAILLADVSGMSKAETERIWLTFTFTVWCAAGLLRASVRRPALLAAAIWALAINHVLLTEW